MEYNFNLPSWLKHAWNAFTSRSPTKKYVDMGTGWSYRPDRVRLSRGNERSIVTAIYNRIARCCPERYQTRSNRRRRSISRDEKQQSEYLSDTRGE